MVTIPKKTSYSNTPRLEKLLILIFLVFCISLPVAAYAADVKPDSSDLYKKIEMVSKHREFTKVLYGMFFTPFALTPFKKHRKAHRLHKDNFEGKIIRHINIVTIDPFGYSINDTAVIPKKLLFKIGNNLHVKTHPFTIKNILLFRENDSFDLLLVKESERLIRSLNYVYEVVFQISFVENKNDLVELYKRIA